jgi:hypothetical protein
MEKALERGADSRLPAFRVSVLGALRVSGQLRAIHHAWCNSLFFTKKTAVTLL